MNLYAWKYYGGSLIIYTLVENPEEGAYIYNENGELIANESIPITDYGLPYKLRNTINECTTNWEGEVEDIRITGFYREDENNMMLMEFMFSRDALHDISDDNFISKFKHDNVTYIIKDAQAREDILNKQDKLNEFVVTQEIYDKYKKNCYDNGTILDIADMILGENLYGYCNINLNTYRGYLNEYSITYASYTFTNGDILLDNISQSGCGRAVTMNNSELIFRDCYIYAPQCSDNSKSMFELNNAHIGFKNSEIFAKFTENKSFIKVIGNNCLLSIDNTNVELICKEGLQNPDFGFDFIEVVGNDSNITIKNCQKIRLANDETDTNEGIEYNLIKTGDGIVSDISIFNNVIYMHGKGYSINQRILNINLDNQSCQISNNDLHGNLYSRYESNNTINNRFEESGGEPVTFNEGDEVWDLSLIPQQADDSRDFEFNNIFDFCEAINVNPNDMSKLYNRYRFTWKEINGQSGFIFQYNEQESYTTDDLISITDLEDDYSIRVNDDQPEQWDEYDWIEVILNPYAKKFRIDETFTIDHNYEFMQQVDNGNASEIQAHIDSFNNNSFKSEEGGYPNFFSINSDSIATSRLILNGKEYTEIENEQPNLYDIKTLEQKESNKEGWACISKTTRQDLAKADVPTLYNNIKTKYYDCDTAPSSSYTTLLSGNFLNYTLCIDDTYIYATNTDRNQQPTYLKRTLKSIFPTTDWENTNIDITELNGYKPIEVGSNLIIFQSKRQNQTNKIYIYKKSDLSFIKSIDIKNNTSDRNSAVIHLLKVNGNKTFFLSYKTVNDNYVLSKMDDNISANEIILRNDLISNIGLPAYDESNNTFWFWYNNYICKSSDEFQTIESVKSSTYSYGMNYFPSVYIKDDVIMFTSMDNYGTSSFYSVNSGITWDNVKNSYGNNIKVACLPYFDGETLYAQVWDDGYDTHIYKSTDLKTFTSFMSTQTAGTVTAKIIYEPTMDTLFLCEYGGGVKYLSIIKTIYTDTYIVNGSSVNVNYYKYDDFKICLPDNTNDTNLATVYNYLGYYNYYRLNIDNETISLPRNNNLYSMMYVGDNYIEEFSNIDGEYSPFATKSEIPTKISDLQNDSGFTSNTGTVTSVRVQAGTGLTSSQSTAQSQTLDTTIGIDSGYKLPTNVEWDGKESYPTTVTISTASISLAIEGNKNYILDNADITDITISSCETSYQETTIQITTGATAPTLTDSSGITWIDGSAPILQANMNYLILIWNKKGFVREY